MKRRQLLHTVATAAAALAATTTPALRARANPGPAAASEVPAATPLIAALQARLQHQGVGLVAAVVDGKQVVFAAAGRRHLASETAPHADTLFEIGSITKTFTALLLADSVQRRELALDDPVEDALGGARLRDSTGAPITWADLATHRSGLPRLPTNMKPAAAADPYADYSLDALRSFVADWRPEVPRDSRWVYSNLGYGLLGQALALRSGLSYARMLRERVLQPLQLDSMVLATPGLRVEGLASGHDAQRRAVPHWHFDAMAPAGALLGSARALARYAQAALGLVDTPLQAAFTLALTPRATGGTTATGMGLGWMFGPLPGVPSRRGAVHDGATFGFASSLILDPQHPQRPRAALVLANAQMSVQDLALHALDPATPPRDLAAETRRIQSQTQRPAASVDAIELTALAGTYALSPQFKVTVRVRDGRLFSQATGQGEFELFALDARRWFARVATLELHFEGSSGAPPAFVLLQAGQRLRFVRE
ncbi:MAG: serine hydrolase [Rubrivivax sp.]|nr:serine hydrolase [Rubrivivax sp.]